MENNSLTHLDDDDDDSLSALQLQLHSLQRRVQELETENARLSSSLSSCVCQKKNVTSDNNKAPRDLGCGRPIHETNKSLQLVSHSRQVKTGLKDKLPDDYTISMHHLPKRYIALKVMYFGKRFYGFASEGPMDPTVESEIFKALKRTRLIFGDKKELQYSRCGRTDKGVSSVGQVISLFLRSNIRGAAGSNGYSGETFTERSCCGELDYVKILNRVLPDDVRIIGWSPASTDFSARFSCLSREYKYFFWRENLDIKAMEVASKKFTGEHDFRSFCKMDAANVHNYRRHITSFEIIQSDERSEGDQLCTVKVKGSAFLWHQIRCMVAVLFLIGQGLESPDVIDLLLDIEKTPRKPQYKMAPEIPLVLRSCEFEDLKFMCSLDARKALLTHFEKECRAYKLQSAIFQEALLSCSDILSDNTQLDNRTKKKESAHVPLMSRPTEPSYEERCSILKAGGGTKR